MTISEFASLRETVHTAIDPDRLVDTVRALAGRPSPRGCERALSEHLAGWATNHWAGPTFRSEAIGASAANLVATAHHGDVPELLIYSHLDTSLTGDPHLDWLATGVSAPVPPLEIDPTTGLVSGFGLGVAKAAAAAALVGYAAAATAVREAGLPHRLTLLLASAGTHRSPLGDPAADVEPTGDQPTDVEPTGVEHYLGTHRRPDAAVVAKSGPAGVLYEEPGAMFLRIRLATELRPVLARDVAAPRGGLIAHLGTVIDLAEQWRTAHLRARPATGQIAAEVGIGAVRGGLPAKPDLLPGLVELHLYAVTLPGDDPQEIAAGLRHALRTGISGGPLADCTVTVDARLVHAAAATRPDARIVRHAVAAWESLHRSPAPDISSWRGCTDGVVLRGQGIDTARLGPAPRPDPADPRREVFALPDLVRFARIYADIALRHALDTQ